MTKSAQALLIAYAHQEVRNHKRGTKERRAAEQALKDQLRIQAGDDFTDREGNYWGHFFNQDGKRVRCCIPVK